MGPKILSQVSDAYRKLRFTLRFLLGNVHDFDPATNAVPYDALPATDRFLLATFGSLLTTLASSYENYQFYRVYQARLLALHVSSIISEDPKLLQILPSPRVMGPCLMISEHLGAFEKALGLRQSPPHGPPVADTLPLPCSRCCALL